jgi:glycosyltransferase involved in cell wall biosynthesis
MKSLDSRQQPSYRHTSPTINTLGTSHDAVRVNDEPLLVSLVIPAYNEGSILQENLERIEQYTHQENKSFCWEFVIINDGSKDDTGAIATQFSRNKSNVVIVHHPSNLGLGQALKSGFAYAQGDYIITLDVDLSYAPYH